MEVIFDKSPELIVRESWSPEDLGPEEVRILSTAYFNILKRAFEFDNQIGKVVNKLEKLASDFGVRKE